MTDIPGREHYQDAKRCLTAVNDDSESSMALLAEAQVHTLLACWEALADIAAELSIIRKQGNGRP